MAYNSNLSRMVLIVSKSFNFDIKSSLLAIKLSMIRNHGVF
jgi:hypothetical protein